MSNIAVVGINGFLGKSIIKSLLSDQFTSKINKPIRLITSSPDKKTFDEPDGVKYINSHEVSYTEALKGVDTVINLTNALKFPNDKFLEALIANDIKLYIPSQFCSDIEAGEADFPNFLDFKRLHSIEARKAGIKTIDVCNGLFYEDHTIFGFDLPWIKIKKDEQSPVTVTGDPNTKINLSSFDDIGKSVAAMVTHRDGVQNLPDTIRFFSESVTYGDLISSYEKRNNVKLNVTWEDGQKYRKEFIKEHAENGTNLGKFLGYFTAIILGGDGKGMIFDSENEKELINPGESLFKWTKTVN